MESIVKTTLLSTFALIITLLLNVQAANAQGQTPQAIQGKTVMEVVDDNEKTGNFASMLKESGYAQVLNQQGPYTILAPSNEAIKAEKESMGESPVKAKKLVQGHLYQGEVPADQIESQMGVTVTETDETPANGVVHIVDSVVKKQ